MNREENILRQRILSERDFALYLHEEVPTFVSAIVNELKASQYGIDVTNLQADHVCYRTESMAHYTTLVRTLLSHDLFSLLVESEIGGRPIATFKLSPPIKIDSGHSIDVIEIPSPKEGSPYTAGLEHIEFVIGDGTHKSPRNDEVHAKALDEWMGKHKNIDWNTKAKTKECNPDVSTKIDVGVYGKASVKFHLIPLSRKSSNLKRNMVVSENAI